MDTAPSLLDSLARVLDDLERGPDLGRADVDQLCELRRRLDRLASRVSNRVAGGRALDPGDEPIGLANGAGYFPDD